MSEHSEVWAPIAAELGVWNYDEGLDIDLTRVPQSVIMEAARRGMTHVLNNEAMSKAGTVVDKAIAAGDVLPDNREERRQQLINEYRLAYIDAFYDGTWGTGRRASTGPRVDALETEFNRLMAKEVREILTKNKAYNYDKAAKNWFVATPGRPNRVITLEQAIESYSSKMTEDKKAALMAGAAEIVAAKKRQAEASKVATATANSEEELPI